MSFLYIISHPQGWLKVGRAINPAVRLGQHQQFSGAPLKGEFVFPCEAAVPAERQALTALASHRIMGEWFHVDIETACAVLKRATGSDAAPFPQPESRTICSSLDRSEIAVSPAQLRTARGLLAWSQSQLASEAGISRATLMRIEDGATDTKATTLVAIRDALRKAGVRLYDDSDGVGEGARMARPDAD